MDKIYRDGNYIVIEEQYTDTVDILHRVENPHTETTVIKYTKEEIKQELLSLEDSKNNLSFDSESYDAGSDSYFIQLEFLDEQIEFFESLLAYFK